MMHSNSNRELTPVDLVSRQPSTHIHKELETYALTFVLLLVPGSSSSCTCGVTFSPGARAAPPQPHHPAAAAPAAAAVMSGLSGGSELLNVVSILLNIGAVIQVR